MKQYKYFLKLILGFYFGFRCGVVSKTAKDLLSSTLFMHVIGCRSYNSEVSIFNMEAPRHLKPNEVDKYLCFWFYCIRHITSSEYYTCTCTYVLIKVLIEVKAGSLDFIDLKIAKGYDRGLLELVNRWVIIHHLP